MRGHGQAATVREGRAATKDAPSQAAAPPPPEQVPQHGVLRLRRLLPQAGALLAKRHRLEQGGHLRGRQRARHVAQQLVVQPAGGGGQRARRHSSGAHVRRREGCTPEPLEGAMDGTQCGCTLQAAMAEPAPGVSSRAGRPRMAKRQTKAPQQAHHRRCLRCPTRDRAYISAASACKVWRRAICAVGGVGSSACRPQASAAPATACHTRCLVACLTSVCMLLSGAAAAACCAARGRGLLHPSLGSRSCPGRCLPPPPPPLRAGLSCCWSITALSGRPSGMMKGPRRALAGWEASWPLAIAAPQARGRVDSLLEGAGVVWNAAWPGRGSQRACRLAHAPCGAPGSLQARDRAAQHSRGSARLADRRGTCDRHSGQRADGLGGSEALRGGLTPAGIGGSV